MCPTCFTNAVFSSNLICSATKQEAYVDMFVILNEAFDIIYNVVRTTRGITGHSIFQYVYVTKYTTTISILSCNIAFMIKFVN